MGTKSFPVSLFTTKSSFLSFHSHSFYSFIEYELLLDNFIRSKNGKSAPDFGENERKEPFADLFTLLKE